MATKQGHLIKGDFLSIRTKKNSVQETRFAFVVGGSVDKKAVVRNTIKRRLRAAAARHISGLKHGFDCVVLARAEAKRRNFKETETELLGLIKKEGLLI